MKHAIKTRRELVPKIAVPTDFSLGSTSAMDYALALARPYKSRIIAVHAVDPFEYSFGPKDIRFLRKQEVWTRAQEAMSQWLKTNSSPAAQHL